MKMALLILIQVLSLIICASTMGQEPSDSLNSLKEAANQGDAQAQYELGYMYYKGDKILKNYNEAATDFPSSQ